MSDWRSQTRKVGTLEQPKPSAEQVRSWLVAEISLLKEGPVPITVFGERADSCMNCEHRIVDSEDYLGYCNKCGCGAAARARLTNKLHMPRTECPLGKWGHERGEGRKHLRRIGGTATQVREQVKQAAGGFIRLLFS